MFFKFAKSTKKNMTIHIISTNTNTTLSKCNLTRLEINCIVSRKHRFKNIWPFLGIVSLQFHCIHEGKRKTRASVFVFPNNLRCFRGHEETEWWTVQRFYRFSANLRWKGTRVAEGEVAGKIKSWRTTKRSSRVPLIEAPVCDPAISFSLIGVIFFQVMHSPLFISYNKSILRDISTSIYFKKIYIYIYIYQFYSFYLMEQKYWQF